MDSAQNAVLGNLLSPVVLSFVLGMAAGLVRAQLSIPEAVGRGVAIYLMFAIGLKGGVAVAESPLDLTLVLTILAGLALSFLMPLLAYLLLRFTAGLSQVESAAVAAHYGSISVVTFVAATLFLGALEVTYEGYLVAVLALMETPAIISGVWLARRGDLGGRTVFSEDVVREIFLNASVVLLVGGFLIGWVSGPAGLDKVAPFFKDPFTGVLCLFLLDMGLLASRRIREARVLRPSILAFGIYMPLVGASLGLALGVGAGLSLGGATLLSVLAASASYIAVPAAMRLALPQANPALSLTLSLAVTFPFNIVVGIPLYFAAARMVYGL
ncbi:MAG: sodium-dependent bicarbonate transport family permease [Myxococcota bacterium]